MSNSSQLAPQVNTSEAADSGAGVNGGKSANSGTKNRQAPGPNLFGSAQSGLRFLSEPFDVLEGNVQKYGPIVRFDLGRKKVLHLIHKPQHVQHVLLDNNRNYHKYTPYGLLKVVFGNGLLFNEGKSWFSQRRLLQPAFMPGHFSTMAEGVGQAINSTVSEWPRVEKGQETDIEVEMAGLSRHVVGQVLFGKNLCDDLHGALKTDGSKLSFLLGTVPFMPQNKQLRAGIKRLDNAVYEIIRERRGKPDGDSPDILGALLRAVDKDTGETMGDKQLRDEIVTLLFSGYDTTSRTLTWVFHALSQNPRVEARLHEELETVLGGRAPVYSDLPNLTYTDLLIKEAMRVYPANPIIGRQAKEDDSIDGYHIPAGSIITLSQYLAHRDPAIWKNAEVFEPERWVNGEPARFSYFPFGGGPRQCIGKGLAMMTIPLAIATIAQQYRFAQKPHFAVQHDIKVTFQSRHGIQAIRQLRPTLNGSN